MDCLVTTLKADTQNNNLPLFEKLEIAVNNVGSVSNFLFQSTDSSKISLYDGNGDKTGEISSKTTAQTIDFTGVTKLVVENKYKLLNLHLSNTGFSFDIAGLYNVTSLKELNISGSSVFGNITKLQKCINLGTLDCWNVSGINGDMGVLATISRLGVGGFLNVKIGNVLYDLKDFAAAGVASGRNTALLKSNAYAYYWSNMLKLNNTTCTSSNFNSFGWEKVTGEDRIKIAYYQGSQTGASGASKIFHYGYTTAEIEALSAGGWSGKTLVDCN